VTIGLGDIEEGDASAREGIRPKHNLKKGETYSKGKDVLTKYI